MPKKITPPSLAPACYWDSHHQCTGHGQHPTEGRYNCTCPCHAAAS